MIAGREGRNLRFQRFAFGGLLALATGEWIGLQATRYIFFGVFALTLVVELYQERKR